MRKHLLIVSALLLLFAYFSEAQKITPDNAHRFYSLDGLPRHWQLKPRLLRTIDDLLPMAVSQLKDARPCINCNARYTITFKIDTVYIIDSHVEELDSQRFSYTHTIRYFYKSYLAVREDSVDIARVLLTSVDDAKIYFFRRSVKYDRQYAPTTHPVIYLGPRRSWLLPGDSDLEENSASAIKRIRKMMKHW